MTPFRAVAIIPARMASSRLPGKPLLQVRGLPMIEHVRRRVALCRAFAETVVATCDDAIADVVREHGGRAVMTATTHPGATDRVCEAMQSLDCTHVVNIQGDEILVLPEDLETMVEAMRRAPEVPAWNAVAPIEQAEQLRDRSIVKCALTRSGRVLACARDYGYLDGKLGPAFEPLRHILGVLGYRRDFLARYGALARTPLETAESVDQSRVVEHDVQLQSVPFSRGYPGINEPREVPVVEEYLANDARQRALLERILSEAPTRPSRVTPGAA